MRAVIDTDVLVCGLLSPAGNEALILLAVQHRFVVPCLSEPILQEYHAVPAHPKFAFPADDIAALFETPLQAGANFSPSPSPVASPDPGDTKFLHCALAAHADFIITGNKRHFPLVPDGKVRIVNAGELLNLIASQI